MKIIDLYESKFLTDEDEIIEWMYKSFMEFDSTELMIEPDGLVYGKSLSSITDINKLKVQFKSVTGYFNCSYTSITSLEGCPQIVGHNFSYHNTNITSLEGCPKSVNAVFNCHNNKITDPREYRFALYCEIGEGFYSGNAEVNKIINTYGGSSNRKYWAHAINLLSKVQL